MRFYSLRIIDAKGGAEALRKARNGEFNETDELSDVILSEKHLLYRLKIKKLVSLNPDRKQTIELGKLIPEYGYYCYLFGKSGVNIGIDNLRPMKTFEDWLATEI